MNHHLDTDVTQLLEIHPVNPQTRLISQAISMVNKGGVIVYPTDSAYALGCRLGDKEAMERIKALRQLPKDHNFTLICQNLSDLSAYAQVSNSVFRILKAHTPGPYTFILEATHDVPRRLQHPKKKTIGLRVPDHAITQALITAMGEPLMSVTLILPGEEEPLSDPEEIYELLKNKVDLIIDGGFCGIEPTTVVGLVSGVPEIIRVGKGDPQPFQSRS